MGCRNSAAALIPFVCVCLWACQAAPVVAADEAAASELQFVDESGGQRAIAEGDLAKLSRVAAKVTDRDGQTAEYEGVRLSDLLGHLGVALGKDLRGPRVANYVLVEAADGYRVTLAIGEVDPATTDKLVLLANRKDGAALPQNEGPWRLVIPEDKRPVRWIRMVTRIGVHAPAASAPQK